MKVLDPGAVLVTKEGVFMFDPVRVCMTPVQFCDDEPVFETKGGGNTPPGGPKDDDG